MTHGKTRFTRGCQILFLFTSFFLKNLTFKFGLRFVLPVAQPE